MSTKARGEYLAGGNHCVVRYLRSADAAAAASAAAVLGHLAAAAEVEAVDAGAEVGAAGLHAVPGEHAHALLARALAHAAQRLDLAVGA